MAQSICQTGHHVNSSMGLNPITAARNAQNNGQEHCVEFQGLSSPELHSQLPKNNSAPLARMVERAQVNTIKNPAQVEVVGKKPPLAVRWKLERD